MSCGWVSNGGYDLGVGILGVCLGAWASRGMSRGEHLEGMSKGCASGGYIHWVGIQDRYVQGVGMSRGWVCPGVGYVQGGWVCPERVGMSRGAGMSKKGGYVQGVWVCSGRVGMFREGGYRGGGLVLMGPQGL